MDKGSQDLGAYPQYGWDFLEEIPARFRKDPETLSERFLEFPSRVRLGCPKTLLIQGI